MNPHLEFQRLQVLRGLHLLTTPSLPKLDELCQRVQERFDVEMVLVTVVDRERQIVKARVGTDFAGSSRPDAFCDQLIRSDEVLVVRDARRDPRFATNPLVTGAPFIRFYAGAPLIYMRGTYAWAASVCWTRSHGISRPVTKPSWPAWPTR